MNNVQAQLAVTLTSGNYNGTNISCFGSQDGSITANPTGGTLPYTYLWSNQETGQTIAGLAAGYYRVEVKDATGAIVYGEITLTEPEAITLQAIPYTYSNNYNISCYSCSNGIIDVYVNNGTLPYTYLWNDGNTNHNRAALSPGTYLITVTDANGCTLNSEQLYLTEPERSDWTILGNTNSNAAANFIGTTDSVALNLRTNNTERLSLKANGDLVVKSMTGNGIKMIYADSNGVLKAAPVFSTSTVCIPSQPPTWFNGLNGTTKTLWTCPDVIVGVGTTAPITRLHVAGDAVFTQNSGTINSAAFIRGADNFSDALHPDYTWWNSDQTGIFHPAGHAIAFTNEGNESMRIVKDNNGNLIVGIGLDPLTQNMVSGATPYKLMVEGKIGARDIVVRNATLAWPDYVFDDGYKLLSLAEIETYVQLNKRLPGFDAAKQIASNGQNINELQVIQLQKIEELYLYIIGLEKRVKELEKKNETQK